MPASATAPGTRASFFLEAIARVANDQEANVSRAGRANSRRPDYSLGCRGGLIVFGDSAS
ncbi:MAG: hypothetical protein WAQ52_04650 [Terriglobales bacterium]